MFATLLLGRAAVDRVRAVYGHLSKGPFLYTDDCAWRESSYLPGVVRQYKGGETGSILRTAEGLETCDLGRRIHTSGAFRNPSRGGGAWWERMRWDGTVAWKS